MQSMADLPLRDIHLPAAIGWWPPAIGWWLVAGCGILILIFAAVLVWRYFKPSLRKDVQEALHHIEIKLNGDQNTAECLSELSVLLRRAALSQKKATQVAGLSGEAWLQWLDKPLKEAPFSQGVGRLLLSGPYQRQADREEVAQLIQLCHKWVKNL